MYLFYQGLRPVGTGLGKLIQGRDSLALSCLQRSQLVCQQQLEAGQVAEAPRQAGSVFFHLPSHTAVSLRRLTCASHLSGHAAPHIHLCNEE